jgi:hypothetical protein
MQKFFSQGVYNEKSGAKISAEKTKLPKFDSANPQVFFDVAIGHEGDEGYTKE